MKALFSLGISLLLSSSMQANIGPAGFGEFLNPYFVETGTLSGHGIMRALKAGFKFVRSIDSDKGIINHVRSIFKHNKNIQIFHGDSSKDLWLMIKDIDQLITFWLDAHMYPPLPNGGKNCPLIEELRQIKMHPIKTHTILIDDMHCAGTAAFDFLTKDDLIREIREINPCYQITYVAGGDEGEYPNNVMVARVR